MHTPLLLFLSLSRDQAAARSGTRDEYRGWSRSPREEDDEEETRERDYLTPELIPSHPPFLSSAVSLKRLTIYFHPCIFVLHPLKEEIRGFARSTAIKKYYYLSFLIIPNEDS